MRATDTDDAIDAFNARRRVQANAVTINSWDPTQLVAPAAEQSTSLDIGELPAMPIYDGSAERRHADTAAADPHSRLMLQALELDNKLFDGDGAVRRLAAGHRFHLTQHERYANGDNGFTTLWVEHEARNNVTPAMDGAGNLPGVAKAGLATLAKFAASTIENGTYRNRFGCVRDTVAIVPRAAAARYTGVALGPQTALEFYGEGGGSICLMAGQVTHRTSQLFPIRKSSFLMRHLFSRIRLECHWRRFHIR
ncbi:hypothetical protein ASF61_21850 [Duganella sp. Leaf126]|uniref:contractile injection system protein, VgrG/Pvc8 family n=1 Tax=Duganella sp. Leaf126 TaxID=1736266 RepID=UPI000700849E|nr:contractile injection system protein, VgrG/Pvc8 family [Duganella sp. Leaf126]KQQ44384.1 hypothetical protein ASF61_21850 [Duganella sp. Leaf126]